MREILWVSFLLSAASYLVACLLFLAQARRRSAVHLGPQWAPRALELGAVLQFVYLILFAVMDRRCPVYSLHSALGIVSLVGVASYAVLSRGRHLEALGGFVAASAAVFLVVARSLAASTPDPNQRWLMAIHITSNLLGGGILLVAGCASAFYLVNERRLKSRRVLGQGPKLPPLESLDAVVHRLLWIGLPLLTIGLLTGRMVIKHAEVITVGEKFRAALSGTSWLLLMAVLIMRQFASWRGRRPAYATLGGALGIFVVIALYIARALLGEGL
ncbi:MAG TPA: cytochrome c biogenesis protein CcsA [Polyangia bacterium]